MPPSSWPAATAGTCGASARVYLVDGAAMALAYDAALRLLPDQPLSARSRAVLREALDGPTGA